MRLGQKQSELFWCSGKPVALDLSHLLLNVSKPEAVTKKGRGFLGFVLRPSQDSAFALLICLSVLIFAHVNTPPHCSRYKAQTPAVKSSLYHILENWIKSSRIGKQEGESSHSHGCYKFILNVTSKHPILRQLWPFTSNLKYVCLFPQPHSSFPLCFHSLNFPLCL